MLKLDLARLAREGRLQVDAEIPPEDPLWEGSELTFAGPLRVEGVASIAGSGEVVVRGRVEGTLARVCRRCLDPVEFIDFQCPFCRQLAHRVDTLMAEYPGTISITMHHFPLSGHALALPVAVGAECADEQGAFERYFREVLLGPEPLGVFSLEVYGERAGVGDISRFRECLALPADSFPRIEYGLELDRRTGGRGTPTVWLEGLRLVGTPSLERLRELVAEALDSGSS